MKSHLLRIGNTLIHKRYPDDDPIWKLPIEKQDRQLIADVRKDLEIEADRLVKIQITERG